MTHKVQPDEARDSLDASLLVLSLAQEQTHAMILLDVDARVVRWFPGASQVLGWDAQEMRGQTLERIFPPDDLARGDLDWEIRAARSYGKAEDDRWQVRKDGVRIWVSGILTAIHGDSGDIVGFCKILRDRTDIRTQLDAFMARLEDASDAERARHALLGTLAHELRNPLGPLSNAAQFIRLAAPDTPKIATSVQIIERQVRFIESLVQDLLEATRVGVGKTRLHYECVELRTVVDNAIETCSAMINDRSQSVESVLPDTLKIEVDPVRLQQVIVNLLTNSSKFSPPGTGIWIKATVDAHELVLAVEDHGLGIPADLLPRIFELFTQSSEQGANAEHGLGLGLGLVKAIVEMHGGSVQARSEGPSQGTEITVRLPLRRDGSNETCV